eukprot:919772_1
MGNVTSKRNSKLQNENISRNPQESHDKQTTERKRFVASQVYKKSRYMASHLVADSLSTNLMKLNQIMDPYPQSTMDEDNAKNDESLLMPDYQLHAGMKC